MSTYIGSTECSCSHCMCDWAVLLQSVVTQVGELLLAPSTGAGQPLLLSRVSEDMSSSELLFSPLPGQEHSQESKAWQVSTPAFTCNHRMQMFTCVDYAKIAYNLQESFHNSHLVSIR